MTTKARIFLWDGGDKAPEPRGEYEFEHLPRKDDRIIVAGAGPWREILLVLNVTHYPVATNVPAIGRFPPWTEIFVKEIGEEDDE